LTLALDGGEEERELLTSSPDRFTPNKLNWVFSRTSVEVWKKRKISCFYQNSRPGPSKP